MTLTSSSMRAKFDPHTVGASDTTKMPVSLPDLLVIAHCSLVEAVKPDVNLVLPPSLAEKPAK
jgi:hypothetical protein